MKVEAIKRKASCLTGSGSGEYPFSCPAIEHGFDIFPKVNFVLHVGGSELEVSSPGVEVGGIRMVVLGLRRAVEVEDELVGGEVHAAEAALDALGAGAVVAGRLEISMTTPSALVVDLQEKKNAIESASK